MKTKIQNLESKLKKQQTENDDILIALEKELKKKEMTIEALKKHGVQKVDQHVFSNKLW